MRRRAGRLGFGNALIGGTDDLFHGVRRIEECHAADARRGGAAVGQPQLRKPRAQLVEDDAGGCRRRLGQEGDELVASQAGYYVRGAKRSAQDGRGSAYRLIADAGAKVHHGHAEGVLVAARALDFRTGRLMERAGIPDPGDVVHAR